MARRSDNVKVGDTVLIYTKQGEYPAKVITVGANKRCGFENSHTGVTFKLDHGSNKKSNMSEYWFSLPTEDITDGYKEQQMKAGFPKTNRFGAEVWHWAQSFGKKRVGVNFNPTGNDNVDKIKDAAANLIDLINQSTLLAESGVCDKEHLRQQELAMTAIEVGCMHAVKAQTAMAPK